MSVYIPGMEMPKSCLVCSCTDTEYGECVLDPEKRCPEDYGKIADWCPLVPVPDHGRLIDANALKAKQQEDADLFINAVSLAEKSRRDEALNAVANIVNAPTIIPADKEEE